MTTVTSRLGSIHFGPGLPILLINEQLRVTGQAPEVLAELQMGKLDAILDLARFGQRAGLDVADILIGHPDLDEVALLPALATAIHDEIGCPICLDSRNPEALEAALSALSPFKAIINSVTAEAESLEALLPLAKAHGAVIIGMPMGHLHGLPKTAVGRIAEARVILEAAARHGIPREDVVIDGICMASSSEPGSMQATLETLAALHEELNVTTVLGIGNAGFGMPEQTRIDLAYLVAAVPWGLDCALVNPSTEGLIETVRAVDFLTGRDAYGLRYIEHYRSKKKAGQGIG